MSVATKRGLLRTMISSPRLVRELKNHSGCDSAIGLELEREGRTGTVGGHWEDRSVIRNVFEIKLDIIWIL